MVWLVSLTGLFSLSALAKPSTTALDLLARPKSRIERILGKPIRQDRSQRLTIYRGWNPLVKKVRVIEDSLYPFVLVFELDGSKVRTWQEAARAVGLKPGVLSFE